MLVEQWGEILGDAMGAAAPIDRLIHHATMVTLKGKSYRLRERGAAVAPAATRLRLTGRTTYPVAHFSAPDTGAAFGAP